MPCAGPGCRRRQRGLCGRLVGGVGGSGEGATAAAGGHPEAGPGDLLRGRGVDFDGGAVLRGRPVLLILHRFLLPFACYVRKVLVHYLWWWIMIVFGEDFVYAGVIFLRKGVVFDLF